MDQIHTIMSKVAQDMETLQHIPLRLATCGTHLLTQVSDQSPDARLFSRKEVGFKTDIAKLEAASTKMYDFRWQHP
jgi:hypothetical protein